MRKIWIYLVCAVFAASTASASGGPSVSLGEYTATLSRPPFLASGDSGKFFTDSQTTKSGKTISIQEVIRSHEQFQTWSILSAVMMQSPAEGALKDRLDLMLSPYQQACENVAVADLKSTRKNSKLVAVFCTALKPSLQAGQVSVLSISLNGRTEIRSYIEMRTKPFKLDVLESGALPIKRDTLSAMIDYIGQTKITRK